MAEEAKVAQAKAAQREADAKVAKAEAEKNDSKARLENAEALTGVVREQGSQIQRLVDTVIATNWVLAVALVVAALSPFVILIVWLITRRRQPVVAYKVLPNRRYQMKMADRLERAVQVIDHEE